MYSLTRESSMSRKPKTLGGPPPAIEDDEADEHVPALPKRPSPKNDTMLAAIGRKVVESRKALHMSQSQLAKAAECPTSTVFSVENGQHNTSLSTLQKIADALKMDVRDLLPGTNLPPATNEGIAMLKLVESALQTTRDELNRTTVMVEHVLKMVSDMQKPSSPKRDTEH